MKTDKKEVHVEREEEREPEAEMTVRRWTKEENKLAMRCFKAILLEEDRKNELLLSGEKQELLR